MNLAHAAARMQALLTDLAEQAAWDSGACRRTSPLAGAALVLVLGYLADPDAALEDLAQTAALLGHPVSPQAVDQRFTPALARCLERLVGQAVGRAAATGGAAAAVLRKFAAVVVQDSTTVTLPDALAGYWRGCGTKSGRGGEAAVKFQVRLDLASGRLWGLAVEPGRASDRATPLQTAGLRPGELHLRDLGYFDLGVLAAIAAAGAFFLTRVQDGTGLSAPDGTPLALAALARGHEGAVLDRPVRLGAKQRLAARLVMVRVPPDVAAARRRARRAKAKKKGYRPSADKLALCGWNVFVTNVPAQRLDVDEVLALARARWQVECPFRHWKSDGRLAQSRSRKPWRVACAVFARLLALVVGDGHVQAACGGLLGRSLRRAWRAVRRLAGALAGALGDRRALARVLGQLRQSLRQAARLEKRRRQPSASQLLTDPHGCGHRKFAQTKNVA